MTSKSKAIAKKEPIRLSEEEKREAVRKFISRGDRSAQDIADEVGTSQQMLYLWKKKIDNGEPLDKRSKDRPLNKADLEHARRSAKEMSTAITISSIPKHGVVTTKGETLHLQGAHVSRYADDIYFKYELLLAENQRLKRMLAQAIDASQ